MPADSFGAAGTLAAGGERYRIFRLDAVRGAARLPFSLKVLLENLLRNEDGHLVTAAQIEALAGWDPAAEPSTEIAFTPARVLLQDFTGVPCLVDLAAMREAPRRAPRSATPWSAPTRIPRWSTGWACSAGGWAASRPRQRCWASRSACWSRR